MQESIVFLVRVQCCRKESSRLLSHLLMSFLLPKLMVYQRCMMSSVYAMNRTEGRRLTPHIREGLP